MSEKALVLEERLTDTTDNLQFVRNGITRTILN